MGSENDIIDTIYNLPEPNSIHSSHPINELRIKYALKGYRNEAHSFLNRLNKIVKKRENDLIKTYKQKRNEELYNELNNLYGDYFFFNKKEFKDRIKFLIDKLKNNYDLEYMLASIEADEGNHKRLIESYSKDFKDNNIHKFNSLSYISSALFEQKKIKKIDFEKIIKLNNSNNFPSLSFLLGVYYKDILRLKGKSKIMFKKAYESKNKLKKFEKHHLPYIIFNEGRRLKEIEKQNGKCNQTEILYRRTLNILNTTKDKKDYQFHSKVLLNLADVQFYNKNHKESIQNINKLLKRGNLQKSLIHRSYYILSQISYLNNFYETAIEKLTLAINNCNSKVILANYYFFKGKIYLLNLNNKKKGLIDLSESCKYGSKSACKLIESFK